MQGEHYKGNKTETETETENLGHKNRPLTGAAPMMGDLASFRNFMIQGCMIRLRKTRKPTVRVAIWHK